MNKLYITLFATAAAVAAAAYSSAPAAETPTRETLPPPLFYGSLEQSTEWTQTPKVGIYSFGATDDAGRLTACSGTQSGRMVTGGAAYVDGYLYYINGTSTYLNISNTFNKMDVETWRVVKTSGHTSPTKTDALCMAYDYSTSTMYAVSTDYSNNGACVLRRVDLETGEFTDVAPINGRFPAIAVDAHGTLYGVRRNSGFPYRAVLCTINKQTGAVTEIGELGYNQRSEYSGMVFDYRTGKLYWTSRCFTYNDHYEETYISYLVEVDPATGAGTTVRTFDNTEVFANLFFIDCHPQAPDAASNLKFNYNAGSYSSGKLTFTVPAVRYDRSALTGSIKAEIYVDGTVAATLNGLTPGSTATSQAMSLADGAHDIKIICYDSASRKSLAASLRVNGGADVPTAVTNLTVKLTERGDRADISWVAPTESANGGKCDFDKMTYRVVRRPDGTTIAEGLTTTSYSDSPAASMQLTQYDVYAVTPAGASQVTHSTPVLVGTAWPINYLETFDTNTRFLTYTAIDNAGTSTAGGNRWMWYPNNREAIYWLDYDHFGAADAWLVTPVLDMKADQVYRLSWSRRGYASGASKESTLKVAVGRAATAAALSREIDSRTYIPTQTTTDCYALFTAAEGDCRIGFRYISPSAADHCGIDNVRVALYGPASIPGAPTGVTAVKNGSAATISAIAPSVDAKGRALTSLTRITLYRADGTVAARSDNPKPGSAVTLSDTKPAAGNNTYIIKAANADGEGLETSVSINMNAPAPKPVTDVKARLLSDASGATIEWAYPADMLGADGSRLEAADLRYDVYRSFENHTAELIASDLSVTTYTDRDVLASYPDRRQVRMDYTVVAKTDGGNATSASARALIGRAYELPIAVSDFYDNQLAVKPWTSTPVTAWTPRDLSYTPRFTPYSGSSMMMCMSNSANSWVSPRINLAGLASPRLSFMMYCDNSDAAARASVSIGIITEKDGVEQPVVMLPGAHTAKADAAGWKQVDVDLSAYVSYNRASIVFVAANTDGHTIGIDNINIDGRKLDHDIRVLELTGPANCVNGRENIYTARICNNGLNPISGATAVFAIDGNTLETRTMSLAVDAEQELVFKYTPELNDPEHKAVVSVTATTANDGNTANDIASLDVNVISPNVPYVNDLDGAWDSATQTVTLTWSEAATYPRAFPVTDDFESYNNYIIDNIGDWTVTDVDRANTMGGIQGSLGTFTWENCGKPQAFIVFNPVHAGVNTLCTARSGNKCLVAFTCATANDDWLISPQLVGSAQTISLYARAMHPAYLNEKFEVLVSRSGTDVSDFTTIKTQTVGTYEWTRYTADLPAGTRYFAIRCISREQYGLMLDDIEYIPAQPAADLHGYHVYCNGTRIAESIGETEYVHTGVKFESNNRYRVSAVYAEGESIHSNEVIIAPAGIEGVGADSGITITATDGAVVVRGAAGRRIAVAATDGRLLYNLTGNGEDVLPVAPGLYIVAAGDRTAKIIVK